MGFSLRIPLFVGALKLKTRRRLRSNERDGSVPMLTIGGVYVIWARYEARRKDKRPSSRDKRSAGADRSASGDDGDG